MDCNLCDVVAGTVPARVLYADETAIAFLGAWPIRRGHTLVIPRAHVPNVMAAGADAALVGMARAVHEVGKRLVEALKADGLSIYQSNGEAAGQELFHLHQHLVPRWHGDARLITSELNTEEADRVDLTFSEVSRL